MPVRKSGLTRAEAARRFETLAQGASIVPTDRNVLMSAFMLAGHHDVPTYDAIILATAAEVRCDILYSEDFQHGFIWGGVEVINPFR